MKDLTDWLFIAGAAAIAAAVGQALFTPYVQAIMEVLP